MEHQHVVQSWEVVFADFDGATPLSFGYGDIATSEAWNIAANAEIAIEVWVAAWALLLSRYTGERFIALGIQGLGDAEIRPLLLEVDEEQPAESYLHFIENQLRSQSIKEDELRGILKLDPNVPLFNCVVFESEEHGLGVRGSGGFSDETLGRVTGHLNRLVAALTNSTTMVRTIQHLSDQEQEMVVKEWNPDSISYPEATVQVLFEKQVSERPDAIALVFGEQQVTYAELNEQANRLAHYLIEMGLQPGQGVATFLERGVAQIISTLAILKAGAVYIPLDIEFPPERICQMLEDARQPIILAHSAISSRLEIPADAELLELDRIEQALESGSAANPPVQSVADSLAYIMYTSGSTGRPKGVEVVHRGIVRLLFGTNYVPFGTDTIILHMAAVSFDASTFEIWGALLHGGTCVLSPSRVPTLESVGHLLAEHEVNTIFMTTALFNLAVAAAPEILAPVRYLLTGGEAQSAWHIEKALRELPEDTQLSNVYGPTENTTFSTAYLFDRAAFDAARPIPIGRAISNSTCYILDRFLRPVSPGVPGELYVGGDGLARGYAGRSDLTAERFLPDPFSSKPDARMYKTGDIVYWNGDGLIEFIGRVDNQIKLRGFRIELQDIDIALGNFPGVEQAVTVVYEDEVRGKWLTSFVKTDHPATFPVEGLKTFAYEKLPDYMVPAAFVPVREWSYTPSGKLDRKSLPKPVLSALSGGTYHPPETETQKLLATVWQRLLELDRVGIDDNFFDLGGDSLRSVHLFHEISQQCGRELPLVTLSQQPTLRGLAAIIDGDAEDPQLAGFRCLQMIQPGDADVVPLFLVHGGQGNVLVYNGFVHMLDRAQPVYAFQWSGWDGHHGSSDIRQMARDYCDELMRFYPEGPIRLGGYCIGGLIAIELVRELEAAGRTIAYPLVVWDSPNLESRHYRRDEPWDSARTMDAFSRMKAGLEEIRIDRGDHCDLLSSDFTPPQGRAARIRSIPGILKVLRLLKQLKVTLKTMPLRNRILWIHLRGSRIPMEWREGYCVQSMVKAIRRHRSSRCPGDMLYFRSDCVIGRYFSLRGWWDDSFLGFAELCEGNFEVHAIGGSHTEVLDIAEMGRIVNRVLATGEQQ